MYTRLLNNALHAKECAKDAWAKDYWQGVYEALLEHANEHKEIH